MIPREIIQEIRDRLDIVDIVQEYVSNLKRAGKNWVGLCPFHNDRNPSMSVSPDMGIYKCFSCGEGGDVFSFVQNIENISFNEAVRILAKKAGIALSFTSENNNEDYQKRDELVQFNTRVVKLFQYFLLNREEGKEALRYLHERGIDDNLIKTFNIGYAPRGYTRLTNFFLKRGFKADFLLKTGLFNMGQRGIKPLFFDRVMFPIMNHNNECVGFGGRALNNEVKPKYINSPETLLYKKSYNLYGLNTAKKLIRETKKVFVVEGYLDVISCYKNGVTNCVAPCGTAITSGQISLLKRFAQQIVFFLDGDDAGKKGVGKALFECINILIDKYVLLLPDSLDPDDYFKSNSLDDFENFEKSKIESFDFLVELRTAGIEKSNYAALLTALNGIFDYIALWESDVIKNSFVERLAFLMGLDKGVMSREFLSYRNKSKAIKRFKKEEQKAEVQQVATPTRPKLNGETKRELDLLMLLIELADCRKIIHQCGLKEEHFACEMTQTLFRTFFIFDENLRNRKNFLSKIDDTEVKRYIEDRYFSFEFEQPELVLKNNVIDRIIDIIKKHFARIQDDLNEKLKLAVLYKDEDLRRQLLEEKDLLAKEKHKLSKLQELKS